MNDEKIRCPACEDGWTYVEEDGKRIRDACYHCGNTGFISPQQHRVDQINSVVYALASESINRQKEWCNSNPDGEGWAFSAAENQMTEREYTTALTMNLADKFVAAFTQIEEKCPELASALISHFDNVQMSPPGLKVFQVDVEPVKLPVNDEEIPF